MKHRTDKIWLIVVLFALLIVGFSLLAIFNHYSTDCPSQDVLSWDGTLRFIDVLDQHQDFRRGNYGRALFSLFEAPTWPPLRGIIMHFVILVTTGAPAPALNVFVSYAFFVLLFPSLLYIADRLGGGYAVTGPVFFVISIMLIQSRELPLYSLTAMLETQGMFFFLWSCYFVYRFYEGGRSRPDRLVVAGLFISVQGLFHTKYPYGVMFLFSLFVYEFLRRPVIYFHVFHLLKVRHFRRVRTFLIITFFLLIALLAGSGQLGDFGAHVKLSKFVVYAGFLLILIDFHVYLLRDRLYLLSLLSPRTVLLYFTTLFPALIWLFMHPVRFNSTLGTQQRIVSGISGDSFFSILFNRIFDFRLLLTGLAILSLISILALIFAFLRQSMRSSDAPLRFRSAAKITLQCLHELLVHPLGPPTFLLVLQLLILDFTTPNKQLRHIYHLLPALLLFLSLWPFRLPDLPLFSSFSRNIGRTILAASMTIAVCFYLYFPPGILSGRYFQSGRTVCSSLPASVYDPFRHLADSIRADKKYILINTYHRPGSPPPGSLAAPLIDMFLRLKTYERGLVRNDSRYRFRNWAGFDGLLVAAQHCDPIYYGHPLALRLRETESQIRLTQKSEQSNGMCLLEFRIKH